MREYRTKVIFCDATGATARALLCASLPQISFCQQAVCGPDSWFPRIAGQCHFLGCPGGPRQCTVCASNQAFHRRDAGHNPENCQRPLQPHRYSVCLLLSLAVGEKIICRTHFVHWHISELTPGPSFTQSQTTLDPLARHTNVPPLPLEQVLFKILPSNSSSEIWPNIQLVFCLTESSAKKWKCQAATEPDSEQQLLEHCGHFKLRGIG